MSPPPLRLLAISGSLRARSVNTAVLGAVQALAPAGVSVALYGGLGGLPPFNPDLDVEPPPVPVADWRRAVAAADALLICSPEYAHGVPGALKNALDWLVSFEGFIHKPVALLNARPAEFAPASLRETLMVMNARRLDAAGVTLPLTRNTADAAALLADAAVRAALQAALGAVITALRPAG